MSINALVQRMSAQGFRTDNLPQNSLTFLFNNLRAQTPILAMAAKKSDHFNNGVLCLTRDYLIFAKAIPFSTTLGEIYTKHRPVEPSDSYPYGHLGLNIQRDRSRVVFNYDSDSNTTGLNFISLEMNIQDLSAFEIFLMSGRTPTSEHQATQASINRRAPL